jgi:hypothetical protein
MNNDLETQGGIMDGGDSGALTTLALQRQRHPVALDGTGAVISKFNRDTMVLTVGLLGTVIFAGLVLVAQDLHPKTPVVTDEATQTGGDSSLNANLAALSEREDFGAKNTADLTSDPATGLDEGLNAENSQTISQLKARSWSPAHRQGSARVTRPRIPSVRVHPSLWAKLAAVKMRLFAFWHRKVAPIERYRGWTRFANKWERIKVSYTAEARR